MTSTEIRRKFLEFFASKGHTIVPSSSLIPDDPSVLLTTAGMQQFKPYYNELDPATAIHPSLEKPIGHSAVSIQKSFRTSDIDEVGDERHLTFFEMLGNFSFGEGAYFKEEAIKYAHEFITHAMGLEISYVTIFKGSPEIGVPKDEESKKIWESLGVSDIREEGIEDVFWGPTGVSGPCGPTTEIYCKNGAGQDIEIWNLVFNQFYFPGSREELLAGNSGKILTPLAKPGVDTGMGLERLAMVSQKTNNIFETDLFAPIFEIIKTTDSRTSKILADHSRAVVFLLSDGVRPSNKGAGYILRRLIRRVINLESGDGEKLYEKVIELYKSTYPDLEKNRNEIISFIKEEYEKFSKTLSSGLKELSRIDNLDAKTAFTFYESFGLPFEVMKDHEKGAHLTREDFEKEFSRHQEVSKGGQEKKFGGHGLVLDTGELKAGNEEELKKVIRLHTATHLLQQALRDVLGNEVTQAGSDITPERLRFDFTFPRKITEEEILKVEKIVNHKITDGLEVKKETLSRSEAEKTGALYFFKGKYPDPVDVYYTGETLANAWSKEFCGGPHVSNTKEIGIFKIVKEEASSSGVRRIKAILI